MALFKRGNIWWMELTAPGGKKLRQSTKTADRMMAEKVQEVRRLELSLNAEQYRQAARAETMKKWSDASDRWLEENKGKRSAKDDRRFAEWWKEQLGDIRLDMIDRDRIRSIAERKKKDCSGSTVNRYLAFLSAVLNAAVKDYGWISTKPSIRRYSEPKGVVRYLTIADIEKLLIELPEHQRNMAEFALATGARQGAIKRLKWTAVNMDKGFCWITAEDSKSGEPICIPLNDAAFAVLSRCKGQHDHYVFTYRGQPIRQVNSAAWRKALKRAGITKFRWHDLRHTWASHHAMNGTPVHVLQELGGWHDTAMVRRYAHLSPESLKGFVNNAAR